MSRLLSLFVRHCGRRAVVDEWPKVRRRMQQEARSGTKPVSAFFLLVSAARIPLLVRKLQPLRTYGITDQQIQAVAQLAAELFRRYTPSDDFEETVPDLWLQVAGERCYGDLQIRNVRGRGFEVELRLPGVVAASTPGLLDDGETGFWTAFMPPAFYD